MAFGDLLDTGSGEGVGVATTTVVLPGGAPGVGELLVATSVLRGNVGTTLTLAGWTNRPVMLGHGSGGGGDANLAYRITDGTETDTFVFVMAGGSPAFANRIDILRFEGPWPAGDPFDVESTDSGTAASPVAVSGSITPSSGAPVVVVCHVIHGPGGTSVPSGSLVEVGEGYSAGGFDPTTWVGYVVDTSPGGAIALATTITSGAGFNDWDMRAVSFRGLEAGIDEPDHSDPEPLDPGRAIVEIYTFPADTESVWDTALWDTTGVWVDAGWQDISPWCVTADVTWGADRGDYGILSEVVAGTWLISTFDPDRVLDPANASSPFYPELVAGLPIRINHEGFTIRTGVVRRLTYSYADEGGTISATDAISILSQAKVPEDSILSDTLYARTRDAIAAAGLDIIVRRDRRGGPFTDPPLAPAAVGEFSVWEVIQNAALEVLHIASINRVGEVIFRSWADPVTAGYAITSPELIDLEAWTDDVGLYSVVRVLDDDTSTVIERRITPTPRYGERVYERTEPTINGEAWADSILADRGDQALRHIPGDIRPLTAASVRELALRQIVEDITLSVPEEEPDVSVAARILGIRFRAWDETTDYPANIRTRWRWRFVTTEATVQPLLEDGPANPIILFNDDDLSDPLYPDGVIGL